MERCDVLVVGGGPAGASLAWGLRDTGLDVL
ncbi:MAG: FAD-dependent monooxygenase, partial [Gammaproteobacteria bacterium]